MKIIAGLILIALSLSLSYAGAVYGWGLEAKSWPIIIGSSIGAWIVATCAAAVVN